MGALHSLAGDSEGMKSLRYSGATLEEGLILEGMTRQVQ